MCSVQRSYSTQINFPLLTRCPFQYCGSTVPSSRYTRSDSKIVLLWSSRSRAHQRLWTPPTLPWIFIRCIRSRSTTEVSEYQRSNVRYGIQFSSYVCSSELQYVLYVSGFASFGILSEMIPYQFCQEVMHTRR